MTDDRSPRTGRFLIVEGRGAFTIPCRKCGGDGVVRRCSGGDVRCACKDSADPHSCRYQRICTVCDGRGSYPLGRV